MLRLIRPHELVVPFFVVLSRYQLQSNILYRGTDGCTAFIYGVPDQGASREGEGYSKECGEVKGSEGTNGVGERGVEG